MKILIKCLTVHLIACSVLYGGDTASKEHQVNWHYQLLSHRTVLLSPLTPRSERFSLTCKTPADRDMARIKWLKKQLNIKSKQAELLRGAI